jgi:methylenetetrahydrofolate reductase (NADPH)
MAASAPDTELKARIMDFVGRASTEITPSHASLLPQLGAVLNAGSAVYVDHPPRATLGQVVQTSVAVQRSGFRATPHIAARRIPNAQTLRMALAELHAGNVQQILLVAGDVEHPAGEFASTLDILESGILERSGIARIGVAGHPEGNKSVGPMLLWDALQIKQRFAERTGISMHIVSQFGLNAAAMGPWQKEMSHHGVRLPIHVGIAGPAPLSALIRFAIQCGIGASARTLMRNLSAAGSVADLATTPDQHLLALLAAPLPEQIVALHFFAFGGSLETARWMRMLAAGEFDIDRGAGRLRLTT